MTPINKLEGMIVLSSPHNWNAEKFGECAGLPVVYGDGFIASYWKPSFKERIMILFGRPIRLCIAGKTQPPVMLDTCPHRLT